MRGDITLGEVKARCEELAGKYGDDRSCAHCEFEKLGCFDPPDRWNVDELHRELTAQNDWEAEFHKSEEACRQMYMKLEDANKRADRADEEIRRLRTIVGAVETMLGRKFEVGHD